MVYVYHRLYITMITTDQMITILNASVEVLFGYGLIVLGSWKSGAPSYSISSGKVVGK